MILKQWRSFCLGADDEALFPRDAQPCGAVFAPLVFLVRRDPLQSRGLFYIHDLDELSELETVRCLTPCSPAFGELADFVRVHGAGVLNVRFQNAFAVLETWHRQKKTGLVLTLVGLGDVGGTALLALKLLGRELGELRIPDGSLIDIDDLDKYRDDELVVLTTGSQGEPMSGLTRMAFSEHRKLQIKQSDKIIISASPIPGNEVFVSRVINQLYRCGAEVIYDAMAEVHVSGHACQEEIKLMHTLVKPKYLIPVHGEYRMLWQHGELAESMGMPRQNIILPEIGQVIELGASGVSIAGEVPTGTVLVDGLGIGDVGNVVLRDRKHLSQDGLIIVAMAFDRTNCMLVSGPDVISRGFVYVRENEDIIEGIRNTVRNIIASYGRIEGSDWPSIKNRIKDELHRYIYDKIKRNPMILPIIVDLG